MIQRCLLAMLVANLSVGCTTSYRTSPRVELGPIGYEQLTPAEYEITGDVKGSASGGRFLIFSYGDTSQQGYLIAADSSGRLLGRRVGTAGIVFLLIVFPPLGIAAALLNALTARDPGARFSAAMYDALEKAPEADAMLLPRFSGETNYIPILWNAWTQEVSGKAIRITKDAR